MTRIRLNHGESPPTITASTIGRGPPIAAAAAQIEDILKTVRDAPAWSMNPEQTRETLVRATRLTARVAELEARLAGHARSIEVENVNGASSTANWWAHETRLTRAGAHRKTKLAAALSTEVHEPVRVALGDGRLLVDQAEEREAEAAAVFRMSGDGHGKSHGRFTVPTYIAEMLHKALLAKAAPKHRAAVDGQAPEPGRPSAHKLGQAWCEYVAGYPAEHLPHSGGVNATVVVTLPIHTLLGGLQAAQLDTGTRTSPGLARKLACEAGIIPAALGTDSQVLDLGRRTRFATTGQRVALTIAQGGCTAQGCDWPPGLCQVHHDQPLCPHHHTRTHDPTYTMTKLAGGKVRFHRRT